MDDLEKAMNDAWAVMVRQKDEPTVITQDMVDGVAAFFAKHGGPSKATRKALRKCQR